MSKLIKKYKENYRNFFRIFIKGFQTSRGVKSKKLLRTYREGGCKQQKSREKKGRQNLVMGFGTWLVINKQTDPSLPHFAHKRVLYSLLHASFF
jgi:hypothetical protein